jgi:hypothetical protein
MSGSSSTTKTLAGPRCVSKDVRFKLPFSAEFGQNADEGKPIFEESFHLGCPTADRFVAQ